MSNKEEVNKGGGEEGMDGGGETPGRLSMTWEEVYGKIPPGDNGGNNQNEAVPKIRKAWEAANDDDEERRKVLRQRDSQGRTVLHYLSDVIQHYKKKNPQAWLEGKTDDGPYRTLYGEILDSDRALALETDDQRRLATTWDETPYGDISIEDLDDEGILAEYEADSSTDYSSFWSRRDRRGSSLLHYLAQDVMPDEDERRTVSLAQRFLRDDPKRAQELDDRGRLPVHYYARHLMDCSDCWTSVREYLELDQQQQPGNVVYSTIDFLHNQDDAVNVVTGCAGALLQAFPESLFASVLLDELMLNPLLIENDNEEEEEEEEEDNNSPQEDNNTNERDQDNRILQKLCRSQSGRVLVTFLQIAFQQGFRHVNENANDICQTGLRNPLHILCSYAYLPVVGGGSPPPSTTTNDGQGRLAMPGLIGLFVSPRGAATPDALVHGLLPLHLAIKSPTIPHPFPNGPAFFQQDKGFAYYSRLHGSTFEQEWSEDEQASVLEVVSCLVLAHPEALLQTDQEGNLPLHLACESYYHNSQLVRFLTEKEPSALSRRNKQGQIPLAVACQNSCSVDVVNHLLRSCPDNLACLVGGDNANAAALDGDDAINKGRKRRIE